MYERFKPDTQLVNADTGTNNMMDVLNFLIAIVLLARMIVPKKMAMIFNLFDEDNDGILSDDQILDMFIRIEKIFCQEAAYQQTIEQVNR